MKSASEIRIGEFNGMLKKKPQPGATELAIAKHLHTVAKAFVQSQQKREYADYYHDPSKDWTPTEVMVQIDSVAEAFRSWRKIREEPAAQAYLVSLLGKKCRME